MLRLGKLSCQVSNLFFCTSKSRDKERHHGDRHGERERSGRDAVFTGGLKTSRPAVQFPTELDSRV